MFESRGYAGPVIQIQHPKGLLGDAPTADKIPQEAAVGTDLSKSDAQTGAELGADRIQTVVSIRTKQLAKNDQSVLEEGLRKRFGAITLLQKTPSAPRWPLSYLPTAC